MARPATPRPCSPPPTRCAAATRTIEITALGTPRGLETRVVPAAGYPLELVPPVPLPRQLNADLLRTPMRLRATVKAALEVIDRVQPDVVVGFGGYVSVPAYLAARRRRLPIVVHEGNALAGIANKLGARFTALRGHQLPGHRAAARHLRRAADPADDRDPRPRRSCARWLAPTSGSSPTCRRCW